MTVPLNQNQFNALVSLELAMLIVFVAKLARLLEEFLKNIFQA